jgi:pyruvate dehydrogenase E2 component (dihydrolipoamide acetyltransferase)
VQVTMPRLSDSMEEGTIARWLVRPGASVEKGQPLVEIDTDKATAVYEAEASGTLLEVLVAEGQTAALGAPIAVIGDPGEARAPVARAPSGGANVSPVARRLARELGVDLSSVTGSGPGGIVTKADIEEAAGDGKPAPGPQVQELTRLQQTVARRMAEGASAPAFSADTELDLTEAVELRESLAAGGGAEPSLNDFVVKAAALALRDFPRLNGSYTDAGFELHDQINVGIAVATEDELVVPVVREADRKSLGALAAETRELAGKVRAGTIVPADLDGGTFTVTNLGMLGVHRFVPILNPPQAGILSVGAARRRPVMDDSGGVVARPLASVTLVCDHRIVYGAEAARFLGRLRELLEQPGQLVEGD